MSGFFHVTHALSSTGNYKRELSALQSRRTLRRSSDKLGKASNNSSSQINGKQKQVSMHTFIYIVSQVTPKIFFRFTIRAGLTNRPKAQPFSLPLCTHFISNYFVPTFEERKNVREWMDLRSQYQRRKTKPRYSIENLRRKKLLAKVMKNYKPFVGYL